MADAGEIYAHAGEQLGSHIAEAITRWQTIRRHDEDVHQKAQGLLDAASSVMVADGKGGQKPFFNKEQIATATNLLHMHKEAQAQAYMQANGFMQAAQRAAIMNNASGGPIYKKDQFGVHQLNPQTGVWSTVNPRNPETGLTAGQGATQTRLSQAARARTHDAQQKQFDTTLKGLGINRQQLFDPHSLEGGTVRGGQFFVPGQIDPHTKTVPIPADKDGNFDQSQITQYRVGYRAPVYPNKSTGAPDTTLPPVDKGKPGVYIDPSDLQGYRDTALGLADPKFKQALQAPSWAQGKDPEAPTDPRNPDSATVGQVLKSAQDYAQSMRKQALTNPEYRRQVLGAATSSATDTTTQMAMPADAATVNPVQQVDAPPPPPEEDTGDE